MKDFTRENPYFSLCGLNCKLCPMHIGGYCPGCGCGPHHSCAVARCSVEHGGLEYCFECAEFPCAKYEGADAYDSFVTHRNQFVDIEKARHIGIKAYNREQAEKAEILAHLLANYNAGRQKNLYCIAVNLLELPEIHKIMQDIEANAGNSSLPLKEKAAFAAGRFKAAADEKGIILTLKKKPKKEK